VDLSGTTHSVLGICRACCDGLTTKVLRVGNRSGIVAVLGGRRLDSEFRVFKYIAALFDAGGQIILGTVEPISDAAVAHDGKKTLAMLHQRAAETVPDLLAGSTPR
jgi:hypothetical protein